MTISKKPKDLKRRIETCIAPIAVDADFSRQKRKAGIGKPNTKGRFAPYKKRN